ncbi:late transcriptional regulator [Kosakonia phage Kc304]|uniref:Late transcription coactivator n=2 Tax=Winklervirus chi14 TaxID=2560752 RepID=A0A1Z1LYQ8_9CAUD|nr:late promoter transcriptional regulator [Serratia phage CHI14]ARW57670.1 late promoter transcription accessory protein [Serratia phage CHI14]ARW57945.1 late promoter transcription accessory protein [Serratia phage CBH8]QYN80690.1 late transcriptional regulator [Kosakonia phage Kc304]UYM28898.1 late promoter transcription accessory protein [Serratia phage vB_SspM_LC53]
MTQFSLLNDNGAPAPLPSKDDISTSLDKQQNGFDIEKLVAETGSSYLEVTTAWLEENSIPEGQFARFIPTGIIDKIMSEAIDDHMLRPSMARTQRTNTLDFLL